MTNREFWIDVRASLLAICASVERGDTEAKFRDIIRSSILGICAAIEKMYLHNNTHG